MDLLLEPVKGNLPTIGLLVAGAAVVLILAVLLHRPFLPYLKAKSLATRTELEFFKALSVSLPRKGLTICPKVRMEDAIRVERGLSPRDRGRGRGRIKSRHFDFVIADSSTLEPLLAIELDDHSHLRKAAQDTDRFKNEACKKAGLPLLRIKTSKNYCPSDLRKSIASMFGS